MRLVSFSPTSHHHPPHLVINPTLKTAAFTPRWGHHLDYSTHRRRCRLLIKDHHHRMMIANSAAANHKIVVIMGPTGCGKSKLSIDLATRFFPSSEVINSDKMQVYRGLDITSNKIPIRDRLGVPHHLLGEFDLSGPELTPSDFRSIAGSTISDIASRRRLPLLVGGSNSFIYSLLAKQFDPEGDVFDESEPDPVCAELRYRCCFLWVDVSLPVLDQYLSKRVDEMLVSGMFEELAEYFDSDKYRVSDPANRTGLRKAIGVPEFEDYFRRYGRYGTNISGEEMAAAYEEAVRAIKENTWQLAKRQMWKIRRLREGGGWDLRRVDATEAVKAAMEEEDERRSRWSEIWESQMVKPSVEIVNRFLDE